MSNLGMTVHVRLVYKCKNQYIGCRDDTVPKAVETRFRACNNLPQLPKTKMQGWKIVACSKSTSKCPKQLLAQCHPCSLLHDY